MQTPIGFLKWKSYFTLENTNLAYETLKFIFTFLDDNRYKIFRWKLLHHILPCNQLLKQWHIVETDTCLHCKQIENYEHFFLKCSYFELFWEKVQQILKKLNIGRHVINLKSIALGYKIHDKEYYGLNLLLTIISYTIYKVYYMSDKKIKVIQPLKILRQEIRTFIEIRNFLGYKIDRLLKQFNELNV